MDNQRTFICSVPACGKAFEDARGLKAHTDCTHIGTVCLWPDCNVRTDTEKELREHIRKYHNPTDHALQVPKEDGSGTVPKYECKWCNGLKLNPQSATRCAIMHVRKEYVKKQAEAAQEAAQDAAQEAGPQASDQTALAPISRGTHLPLVHHQQGGMPNQRGAAVGHRIHYDILKAQERALENELALVRRQLRAASASDSGTTPVVTLAEALKAGEPLGEIVHHYTTGLEETARLFVQNQVDSSSASVGEEAKEEAKKEAKEE